jgi:putative hydrolase of the HAD superfamily
MTAVRPRPAKPRAWIFDLDNTLHDASPHVFPYLNRSMTAYVERHLGIDNEQAGRLRRHYWIRYGATILGLMRHHGIDPHHFLRVTHDFPNLPSMILLQPGLRSVLCRLRGRKVVFSNSPAGYAGSVLRILGIADQFDGVFSIEHTGFRPKPNPAGFLRLLRRYCLKPRGCVMVEDSLENLLTARRLGMETVWVSRHGPAPAWVGARVRSMRELPAAAAMLR